VAVIKPINSGASLEISINYVLREDKTETRLISGVLCIPELALEQMNDTKELWDKTDGRQFKHFIQSFPADENVSANEAHTIGLKFAEKMFPGFEILIATHKDKLHTHTHFIVNSVNLETGYKIQNSYHDLKAMRDYSDELCRQNGLSVLEEWSYANKGKSHSKKSEEIAKRAVDGKYKSHKLDCYRAVFAAVSNAKGKDEFILLMNKSGWNVEWGEKKKHITFTNKNNPKQKNRYSTLAAEYDNYKSADILGEHERLPCSANFKDELLKRFAQNAEPPVVVEQPKPAPLSRQERDRIKLKVEALEICIKAAAKRKKYKPVNDYLEELKRKPKNIFNRKSIEKEISDYEYRHFHQLNEYIDALTILPEGKITPKKWQAELNELKNILDTDSPKVSIKERIKNKSSLDRNEEIIKRERSNKRSYELE
jgi:hypothetical protein